MRTEQVVFCENRKCSVKCVCSERRGSERKNNVQRISQEVREMF